jgi:hypothetical protein
MMKILFKIMIALVLSWTISSCDGVVDSTPTAESIEIISLRENMTALEDEAISWRSDAYLSWADIDIRINHPEGSQVIAASFNSPISEYESLLVYVGVDSKLMSEIVEHEIPVYQKQPITLQDWTIDSQEALDIMLDQDGFEFIQNKGSEQCSFLKLERLRDRPDQPVVWRLTLTECFGDFVRHIILDPITGEILEDS